MGQSMPEKSVNFHGGERDREEREEREREGDSKRNQTNINYRHKKCTGQLCLRFTSVDTVI